MRVCNCLTYITSFPVHKWAIGEHDTVFSFSRTASALTGAEQSCTPHIVFACRAPRLRTERLEKKTLAPCFCFAFPQSHTHPEVTKHLGEFACHGAHPKPRKPKLWRPPPGCGQREQGEGQKERDWAAPRRELVLLHVELEGSIRMSKAVCGRAVVQRCFAGRVKEAAKISARQVIWFVSRTACCSSQKSDRDSLEVNQL